MFRPWSLIADITRVPHHAIMGFLRDSRVQTVQGQRSIKRQCWIIKQGKTRLFAVAETHPLENLSCY